MNNQSSLWADAWRRLLANKAAVAGGLILCTLITLAIFAPWIAPHSYSYQNLDLGAHPHQQHLFLVPIPSEEICLVEFCMGPVSPY